MASEKLCRSSRAKNPITRYAYNEYMSHHYAFTMKVVVEQEPERPSLRHRLEGEKRTNRAKLRRAAQQSREKSRKPKAMNEPHKGRIPRKAVKKVESRMDVNEVEGSETERWTPHT